MRRSKLEIYLDILNVLSSGPLKITHIMYKSNINCNILKVSLDFLIKNRLVEERVIKKVRVVYALSEKGLSALKVFSELKQVLQIEEDKQLAVLLS